MAFPQVQHQLLRIAVLADPIHGTLEGAGRGDGLAATWLPQFASALMESFGVEVHWISLVKGTSEVVRKKIGGHTFLEVPGPPITLDLPLGHPVAKRRLLSVLSEIRPHVVHAWGTERPYPCVLGHYPCPGLLSFNGVLGELEYRGVLPEGWRWRLQCRAEARWVKSADMLTAESKWALEALKKLAPGRRLREIAYGVHPSFYDIRWNPDPDDPFVLFAGTLNHGKGTDVLLQALRLISPRDWRCELAGDGPLRPSSPADWPNGTVWHGTLDWKRYKERLSKAWCLVLPTFADSNPNVVKEARVVGLPIITTIHGGQAEYLVAGENAELLADVTPESLASVLEKTMARGLDELHRMGARNHTEDRERFQISRTVEGFLGMYEELAATGTCL
jgi:glycosyltransferase involved in cell wall biosynthesis